MIKMILIITTAASLACGVVAAPARAADRRVLHDGMTFYWVEMDGPAVVPGPGDLDATAVAWVRLQPTNTSFCIDVPTMVGSGDPTAMRLHFGPAGQTGPVVADLTVALEIPRCFDVGETMHDLVSRPECFYIQIDTNDYDRGAVRGQVAYGSCEPEVTTTAPDDPSASTASSTSATTVPGNTVSPVATRPRFTG